MGVNNKIYNLGVSMSQVNSAISEATSQLATGYTPKGPATVATLNGLSGQENGDLYTMTDAGTLTLGSLAVVAGDTVAWDATNEVWYKAMDYAPSQYGTNEVHNLPTTITAFRTGDVIPVDGPSGTAKMSKDDLLKEMAENAVDSGVAASKSQFDGAIDAMPLDCSAEHYESGFINADGTINTSPTGRMVTDYIDVTGFQRITTKSNIASISAASNTFACFYDENKDFVANETYTTNTDQVKKSFDVPSGAKYVRFTIRNVNDKAFFTLNGGAFAEYVRQRAEEINDNINVGYTAPHFEVGYLNADGTLTKATTRYVTDFVYIHGISKIETLGGVASISAAGKTFACLYDENKVFISNVVYTTSSNDVRTTFEIPSTAYYVRLTTANVGYDAKLKLIGAGIVNNSEKFNSDSIEDIRTELAIYGQAKTAVSYEYGFLASDGTIAESTTRGVSDYIDVEGITKIKTINHIASISLASNTFACFYNSDKEFLFAAKYTTNVNELHTEVNVPKYAKYVRFTLREYAMTASFAFGSFEELVEKVIKTPFVGKNYGKRLALFGGSLTYHFNTTYGENQKWIDGLGITTFNFYGVSGAGFSNSSANNIQDQVDGASADNDVFVLWCSGNDYYGHYEVGAASDYTSDDNYDESKRATQAGGMNYCIKKIYEKNPLATIVILTSLPIFQSENGWVKTHTGTGYYLCDYVKVQMEVAKRWGIPCLNQFEECGFGELNYAQYYMNDNGHITNVGYDKIVNKQIEFLLNAC